MQRILLDAAATHVLGETIANAMQPGDILLLSGSLGVGKTTLARTILRGLDYQGDVPSPSFALLQGYVPPALRLPVAHVDLYRIEAPQEIDELGLDDWLEDGALIIEWPERLAGRFGASALAISLEMMADDARLLTVRVPQAWESRWPR
jgi:tRNA threonylcarbamoyladenosine biosynthesis protein TsaE